MHSAPLRKKSDALRSSARSGYLMRRLRHAVSRPCDAFRAVLEPLLSCASYAADGAAATHPVLRRADRRRVEPTAPRMRRLSPPAGCGGCSVRGKPRRCLRVRHRCPCAFPRGRSTGLGVAGFAIRSRRDRHRLRASDPPVPLVVSPVFPRCTGCVCLRSLWDSPRIVSFGVVSRAKRSE